MNFFENCTQNPDFRSFMDINADKALINEQQKAYSYLFGTISYQKFLLDHPSPEIPPYLEQVAQPLYDEWDEEERYVSSAKGRKAIPSPDNVETGITLIKYLQYLATEIHEKK